MGKISHKNKIWTFPNPTGGIYLPKTDSASLAFQLLPVYKLLDTPEHNVQDYVQDKRASTH